MLFNSSFNHKIIDWSRLKAFADENTNMKFVFNDTENILKKGENAGYQHYLLFQLCLQKCSRLGSLKVRIVW